MRQKVYHVFGAEWRQETGRTTNLDLFLEYLWAPIGPKLTAAIVLPNCVTFGLFVARPWIHGNTSSGLLLRNCFFTFVRSPAIQDDQRK